MENNLLNVKETAKYLNISKETLYRWVHEKKIQYVKLGSRVEFSKEYLIEFIKQHTINPE